MRHKPRNIALLSMLVMLVIGVTASAASAAIQFEWKVNGSPLASGASKEIAVKDKGTGLFHMQFSFGGLAIKLTSSKLKVASGDIHGGKPGTGEERLVFEGVKVESPSGCGVENEKISTVSLSTEIVEGSAAKVGNGKAYLLFTSKANSEGEWAEFALTGTGCALKGSILAPAGSVAAEIAPQKTEGQAEQLVFEAKTKEYRTSKNEFKTAGWVWGGNKATLTGEAETELVSKEVFGAF